MRLIIVALSLLLAGSALGRGGLRSSSIRKAVGSSPQSDRLLDDVVLSPPGMPGLLQLHPVPRIKHMMELEGAESTQRRLLEVEEDEDEEPLANQAERKATEADDDDDDDDDDDIELEYDDDDEPTGLTEGHSLTDKQPAWPHQVGDIPLDPKITYGELPNGFRYLLWPNDDPPGKVEVQLHVDAGAAFETEEERGIAHFLEHMMFQDTESFPVAGELVPAFQRLGVDFGIHLNAYTSLQETVYSLKLPNSNNDTLSTTFDWFKDILGGGALLTPEEIEAEKGVVVSELQIRDSVNTRLSKELYKWAAPDTLVARRFVIGTEETIKSFDKEMLEAFYRKYYVPRRATFVMVGDMKASDMVDWIEQTFGVLEDAGERGDDPDYGTVTEGLGLQTNVLVDEEVVGNSLTMMTLQNQDLEPDSFEKRAQAISSSLANSILSRRFEALGTQPGSVVVLGQASTGALYDFATSSSITVIPNEGVWREAVAVMEQEWRRAMEHGFTQFEVEQAVAGLVNALEQAIVQKGTRQSAELANNLIRSLNGRFVVSTPEANLRAAYAALESLTLDSLHAAFVSNWNTTDIQLYLATGYINGTVEEISEELEELVMESAKVEVEPPAEKEPVVWNYTDFGPPGTVVNDSFVEDLEIRQLILDNNVRVNMKRTSLEAGIVRFEANFGSGKLSQPKNMTFLDDFAEHMIENGGLGAHSLIDLDSASSGKTAGFAFDINQGDFVLTGASSKGDLAFALQLFTAYLADPGYREEAVGWYRDGITQLIEYLRFTPAGAYNFKLFAWLLGGDERFAAPTEEILMSLEASDVEAWLEPIFDNAYLEFSIVGDFNETEAVDMILSTIGALPEREAQPAVVTEADRAISIPEPQSNSFTYESKVPTAGAWVMWELPSFTPPRDIVETRQLTILSNIMSDRLRIKIREELGGSYSPSAKTLRSEDFDYGFLVATSLGLPDEVEVFTDVILEIAANISTGDITQDEFERAIVPAQSGLADLVRNNNYWLNVIDKCQSRPEQLEWSRSLATGYEEMTVEQINALAMEYLKPDLAYPLSIFPVSSNSESNITAIEKSGGL